jgi:hypothetical protein
MMPELLQRAMALNADRLEIEYKDGVEWITAFRGNMGLGIGSVDSTKRDKVFEDLTQLKKLKQVTVLGVVYRLSFSEYESFGETVYEIRRKKKS